MRKLIVSNIMSVDGYYEGPGKNVMDLFAYRMGEYPSDESFDVYNAQRLRTADILLLGHKSYEGFMEYWPSVADDPGAGSAEKEISRRMNAIDKVVVSDSLLIRKTDPWQNTLVVPPSEAHKKIAELKGQSGKDILIFASHFLWNSLLGEGLVDELHLMISPVVLGKGTPIFNNKPSVSLRLIDTKTWDNSGIVLVRYKVSSS